LKRLMINLKKFFLKDGLQSIKTAKNKLTSSGSNMHRLLTYRLRAKDPK